MRTEHLAHGDLLVATAGLTVVVFTDFTSPLNWDITQGIEADSVV